MPLLSGLIGRSAPPAAGKVAAAPAPQPAKAATRQASSSIRDALLAAGPTDRRKLLDDYLRQQTARVLQLSAADLDFRQPLNRMGIDSLMAVELRNILESELAVGVQLVMLLEGASLADLAKALLADLPQAAAPPDAERLAQAMAQLDSLSDDAVEELLARQRLIGS
jgi:acyl carrier protein